MNGRSVICARASGADSRLAAAAAAAAAGRLKGLTEMNDNRCLEIPPHRQLRRSTDKALPVNQVANANPTHQVLMA